MPALPPPPPPISAPPRAYVNSHQDGDDVSSLASFGSCSSKHSQHAAAAAEPERSVPIGTNATTGTTGTGTGFLHRVVTDRSAIVPRANRRGLLAGLCILPEVEDPMEYKRVIKHLITAIVAFAGASAPMASAILFPALGQISEQLHSTPTLANLSAAMYMIGMAIFPLWWSSFAERLGYRTIYMVSFTLYVLSNIAAALAPSIGLLIFFRVVSGASAASAQSIGAGTISSIFAVRERGTAMGVFYLGPLCGPLLGPVIGGALTQKMGWRATMWFLACYGALVLVAMVFALPETLPAKAATCAPPPRVEIETDGGGGGGGPRLQLSRTITHTKQRSRALLGTLRIIFVDPLRSLAFMRFPPVLLTVYWASFAFACLYVLNVSLQMTFAHAPYNFSTLAVGLLYIPTSIGNFVSSVGGGRWNDAVMHRAALRRQRLDSEKAQAEPEYRPEDRMGANAWVAGALIPLALLAYGWLAHAGVVWVAPMLATFFFGVGNILMFSMATTMLTEFVPGRSSSAVAVSNFFRNIASCAGGVVAQPIIARIGNGWLFTVLAVWGVVSVVVVMGVMHRYAPKWRQQASAHEYKFL